MNYLNTFNIIVYMVGAVMTIAGIYGLSLSESKDVWFLIGASTGLILMLLSIMMMRINNLIANNNATPNAE